MAAVEITDLVRTFGQVVAVAGASWQAEAGRVTTVLGPNGAGKSTTIECLEGLQRPDGGTARVLGADPWRAEPDHRARVGVMFQDGGLPNTAKPLALLRHLAALYAAPRDVEALTRRLAGGMRKRAGLARALALDPELLFLDEPTAGLDPHARREVWELMREEAERGACVVVTTHSFEETERVADDVVVMGRGRVLATGTVDDVRNGESLEDRYFALTGDLR